MFLVIALLQFHSLGIQSIFRHGFKYRKYGFLLPKLRKLNTFWHQRDSSLISSCTADI